MEGTTDNHAFIYEPLKKWEIRLLVLQSATSSSSELRAELVCSSLLTKPKFEALSYTWGDTSARKRMTLCKRPFLVLENLSAALLSLRHIMKDRVLWVDALCINQQDLDERRQQVQQMRAIYEQAQQVIIWLGEPGDGGKAGMKRLNYWSTWTIHTWKRNRELGHPIRRDFSSSIGVQTTANLMLEQEYGEISEILDRPWWRRVWIIQEAVLAKQAVLRCGTDEVSWERIRKRTQKLNPFDVVNDKDAAPIYMFPDAELSVLNEMRSSWRAGTFAMTLYELLFKDRRFLCTDPRDRVYSFLGLAIDSGSIGITPDYSITTSELYEKLALALINSHEHLLILNLKRAYHDDRHIVERPMVYSIADQAKFHDTEAKISDGANHKERKGWARLPEGWERCHKHGVTTFIDHRTGTPQKESPLAHIAAVAPKSIASQRVLPPGWVKRWDNLGRVKFEYAPHLSSELANKRDAIIVPSWVPNWDEWSLWDSEPLVCWPGSRSQGYRASGTSSIVRSTPLQIPEFPHNLCLQGLLFDEIDSLAPSWQPRVSSYKVIPSRKGQQVLELWEELALQPTAACPYSIKGTSREEALWRTHIADYVGDLAAPDEDKAFFEVWCDRIGWGPEELEAGTPMGLWETANQPSKESHAWVAAYGHFVEVSKTVPDVSGALSAIRETFVHQREFTIKYKDFRERIHNTCKNRALFITKRGYIGLGPWNTEIGDSVCVLYGGATPFLLRKAVDLDTFTLVGECYVYGIMNGEALQTDKEMGSVLEKTFRIV